MANEYVCTTHGHLLTKALATDGKIVSLPDALQKKVEGPYFCPNHECGIRVVPEGNVRVFAAGYERRGHFNAVPEVVGKYEGPRRVSSIDTVLESIVSSMISVADFDYVSKRPTYKSYMSRQEGEWKEDEFKVDIAARKKDGTEIVLHVIDLPKGSAKDLYHKVKEISIEGTNNGRRRSIRLPGEPEREMGRKVYQNIIVVKNAGSYLPKENGWAVLNPWIHEFVGSLTGNINYFDPTTMRIQVMEMSSKEKISDTHPKDARRNTRMKVVEELSDFTFSQENKGSIIKPLKNRDSGNTINIGNWKIAKLVPVVFDQNGLPMYAKKAEGQGEFIL